VSKPLDMAPRVECFALSWGSKRRDINTAVPAQPPHGVQQRSTRRKSAPSKLTRSSTVHVRPHDIIRGTCLLATLGGSASTQTASDLLETKATTMAAFDTTVFAAGTTEKLATNDRHPTSSKIVCRTRSAKCVAGTRLFATDIASFPQRDTPSKTSAFFAPTVTALKDLDCSK